MSANAIGGAVNLITKSAFEQRGRRASLQLGVMTDSHDFFVSITGTGTAMWASNRLSTRSAASPTRISFFANRLGLVFSAGRDHTNMNGSSASSGLNVFNNPAAPALITPQNSTILRNGVSFAPNRQLRTRTDYSLNTDYRLSPGSDSSLRPRSRNITARTAIAVTFRPPAALAGYTADSNLETYTTTTQGTPARASASSTNTPTPGRSTRASTPTPATGRWI